VNIFVPEADNIVGGREKHQKVLDIKRTIDQVWENLSI
jgi:hypothetical protein